MSESMQNTMPQVRWLARLLFIGLLIFEFLAWINVLDIKLEFTWRGLIGTMLFVWFFLECGSYFLRRSGHHPLHPLTYILAFAVVFFDAFGDIMLYYGTYSWYDQMMHVAGASAATVAMLNLLENIFAKYRDLIPRATTYLLAFGFATFGGVLYELEEYLEDVFTGSNRLGDGRDTANDLLCNTLGIIILLLIIYVIRNRRKRNVQTTA